MTRRSTTPRQEKHCCRDCENSHSPHELDCHGQPFLCKCPFEEWSQFLDIPRFCNHFKHKTPCR